MVEHHLRPLLGFFGCFTVPMAIYAADPAGVVDPLLADRIARAVDQLARLVPAVEQTPFLQAVA